MSVTTIPLLDTLQGPWAGFTIRLVGPTAGSDTVTLSDVYPFISVTDLKRLLWIQMEGDPRWSPERVFLGVRGPTGGIRPIEFKWPLSVSSNVDLPDPVTQREPLATLVDEAGNKRPIAPTMIGSLILESALSPEIMASGDGSIPIVEAISLATLAEGVTAEALTNAMFGGYFQLYFPWLTAPGQILDASSTAVAAAMRDAYAAVVPYMEDRMGRIEIVQRALQKRVAGEAVTMQSMVRLRWTLPPPMSKPESLEKTFYALRATATIPFLRFFPAGGKSAPLLKLALHSDGNPILNDAKAFAQYLNQPSPSTQAPVILARIPIQSRYVERGTAFTLYMFEDGASDITLEVPQSGAIFAAAVASDAQRVLRDVMTSLGFPATAAPALRDVHATYKWTHPDPRRAAPLSTARLQARVAALTPFLETVPLLPEEKATAVFQWRAVSNYESESAQFSYITQLVLRDSVADDAETGAQAILRFSGELQTKFGITAAAAQAVIERWVERHGDAKHSTGASVAIYAAHPDYNIEIQGVDSAQELQRVLSVVSVLLGAPTAELSIQAPVPQVAAVAAAVEVQEEAVNEAVVADGVPEEEEGGGMDMFEMDPAMAALMADLGYGGAEEEVEGGEEEAAVALAPPPIAVPVAAPMPDLDAAVAAVEDECRGTPWAPGEKALTIPADYYMAKLKKLDVEMYGYKSTKTGRVKTYSKTCQRRDERQPNIMTLAEYARVKRCYEDRVRFVNLPPNKPEDLPNFPAYNPKKKYDDDFFMRDPESGKPMWSVYGYENKTRPGEFLYVMCSEFWCDRDNLPLLREEYEGTQGRGFTKPANTCPFCAGGLIKNMEKPAPGESVIQRLPKEATGKIHSYFGFITRTKHPKGWSLPCCDTTPRVLKKYLEQVYTKTIVYGRDLGAEDDEGGAETPDAAAGDDFAEPAPELELEAPPIIAGTQQVGDELRIDYRQKFGSMQTQYILGNDKALEAGKIGLLPPILDAFFGQVGPRSLESRGIRPTFIDGAYVFIRVGVDTRLRAQGLNLFAGLAPLLGFESAEQTQRFIMTQRMVRAFESANYGTLVQEFAARSKLRDDEIAKSLQGWASEFGYQLDQSRAHVVRLYKAWTAFLAYLADTKEPKQLRHLEHLLAQPGTITPRGLLLVTLEQEGDTIKVACPSFGIPTASIFGDVPVSFIWHDRRDESWEPIVLYNNTKNAVLYFGERTPELETLPKAMKVSLMKWLRDWRSSSLGCGRPAPPSHVWTPDRDTTALPRLTPLRQKIRGFIPTTLVRDRSNRLAGVLFSAGAGAGTKVFVPCLDDGALADQLPRVYEADMIPPTSIDTYMKFYTAPDGLVSQFSGLRPVALLASMADKTQIVGFLTEAGTMVPCQPQAIGTPGIPELPIQQLDAFPWERDALILRAPDAPLIGSVALEESTASVEEQLAEAYQYLRLGFSRWLLRDAKGPAARRNIGTILKGALPLYEKRKRMDILLEPIIRGWIATEQTDARRSLSMLRVDCLALPQGECSGAGACRWAEERGCLIHAPVRNTAVTDPVRIFTARLSDELLRYASKRRELLEDEVMTIRTPRGIVRVGDELYMATKPKESADDILDRLGFGRIAATAFPEELLRFEGAEEAAAPIDESVLPASWMEKGLQIPKPSPDLEDPRGLAFAAATGRTLEEWEDLVKARRKLLSLPGDPERPLQWSTQDFYTISMMTSSNLVWARQNPDGSLWIEQWIQTPAALKMKDPMYMIFWGPYELLVSRGKAFRFLAKDLPGDFLTAIDGASPVPEEEAKGVIQDVAPVAQPRMMTVAEATSSEEEAPAPKQPTNAGVVVAAPPKPPTEAEAASSSEEEVVAAPPRQPTNAGVVAAPPRQPTNAGVVAAPPKPPTEAEAASSSEEEAVAAPPKPPTNAGVVPKLPTEAVAAPKLPTEAVAAPPKQPTNAGVAAASAMPKLVVSEVPAEGEEGEGVGEGEEEFDLGLDDLDGEEAPALEG